MSFFESAFLWREAVVASMAVAVISALTGLFAILRRVVFLPAALSQVSGLGVVAAFFLATTFPTLADTPVFSPWIFALSVTLVTAMLLGWMPEPKVLSREAIIGITYIAASALVIIMSDITPQEAHQIDDILFGNAVVVANEQMVVALVAAGMMLVLHIALFRPFLFASFDKETASAHGLPVRLLDALLFSSMGLAIAVSTKTIGALPVFAYSVLPPAAALKLTQNSRAIFILAPSLGAAIAFFGYLVSFKWELPTGACTTLLAAAVFLFSLLAARLCRRRT
jgi:zinc transport system permease protein